MKNGLLPGAPCLILLLLCATGPLHAADAELAAFVDGVMQTQLSTKQTVGATVAIVQNGAVLHSAGYGFANAGEGQRVDPQRTLFRVGSISKVLIWMSVLQQLERAGAKLDEPVAAYLEDVQLDERYAAPVTLRHLMTHSPGFEDRIYGLFGRSTNDLVPLTEYLRSNVPRQVYLPGTVTAYSNYGSALAARVVENLTGENFASYAQSAILQPLGMSATFSQQTGEPWRDRVSQGYVFESGQRRRAPFEYVVAAPVGSLSASADDIARLMMELLEPRSSSVLSSDAKERLRNRAGVGPAEVNGTTLGLFEMTLGDGVRAVGHDGNTMLFHSRMILWPSQKLGLFVSTNTDSGTATVERLTVAFAERYGLATQSPGAADSVDLRQWHGHYGSVRNEHSGRLKLLQLLNQITVTGDANDRRLFVNGAPYQARSGRLLHELDGYNQVYFQSAEAHPDRLSLGNSPATQYQRLRWYERVDLTLAFLLAVLLANLILLLRLPYTAVFRSAAAGEESGRRGAGLTGPVGALVAVLVLVTAWLYARPFSDPVMFVLRDYPQLKQLAWLWFPLALGVALQLALALMGWVRGRWWPARRLFYSLVACLNVALVCWMFFWNLQPLTITGM